MSAADIAVLAALALLCVLAVRNIKRNKCSGDCMNCGKNCNKRK